MTMLGNVAAGTIVKLPKTDTYAEVINKGTGSVTVKLTDGRRTWWSNNTIVELPTTLPRSPQNGPIPASDSKPKQSIEKQPEKKSRPKKEIPSDPPKVRTSKEVDVFGVQIGSRAHRVNLILLKLKKRVTVDMVVKEDPSLKATSVIAHLKRMANDGLIRVKKIDKTSYFSLNKEEKT